MPINRFQSRSGVVAADAIGKLTNLGSDHAEAGDEVRPKPFRRGLTVRIFALWSGGSTADAATHLIAQRAVTTRPYESTGDDHLISGGVKLFIDGSGGARTAWLYDDWNKDFSSIDKGNRRIRRPITRPFAQ
jgi:hypothetical protein